MTSIVDSTLESLNTKCENAPLAYQAKRGRCLHRYTYNQHLALWGCFARIHHDQFPPILQKLQGMSSSSNFVMHLHLSHHDIHRHLCSGGVQNPLHPTSNLCTHHDVHTHTHIYIAQGFSGIQRFKFKIQFCSRQPMCRDRYQGRVFFFAHNFVWQVERCQLSWLLDIHSRQRWGICLSGSVVT